MAWDLSLQVIYKPKQNADKATQISQTLFIAQLLPQRIAGQSHTVHSLQQSRGVQLGAMPLVPQVLWIEGITLKINREVFLEGLVV